MDTGGALLIVGLGLGAAYLLTRDRQPAGVTAPIIGAAGGMPPGTPPAPPSAFKQLELAAPYGGLAATVGGLAQKAPTWLKVVYPPLALNSAVQSLIDHPGSTLKSAGTKVENVVTGAGGAVAGAASSAYHAVADLF